MATKSICMTLTILVTLPIQHILSQPYNNPNGVSLKELVKCICFQNWVLNYSLQIQPYAQDTTYAADGAENENHYLNRLFAQTK